MDAINTTIIEFLNKPAVWTIPLYQRTYGWTRSQCEQLWKDIERLAVKSKEDSHFIGSIVYIESGLYQVSSVSQLLVIDGQQRLTTLSLLLSAISESLKDGDSVGGLTQSKIKNYYLLNNEEVGDLAYKLKLTQSDKDTFWRLIQGTALPNQISLRVQENYKYFINKLKNGEIYKISTMTCVAITVTAIRNA